MKKLFNKKTDTDKPSTKSFYFEKKKTSFWKKIKENSQQVLTRFVLDSSGHGSIQVFDCFTLDQFSPNFFWNPDQSKPWVMSQPIELSWVLK